MKIKILNILNNNVQFQILNDEKDFIQIPKERSIHKLKIVNKIELLEYVKAFVEGLKDEQIQQVIVLDYQKDEVIEIE